MTAHDPELAHARKVLRAISDYATAKTEAARETAFAVLLDADAGTSACALILEMRAGVAERERCLAACRSVEEAYIGEGVDIAAHSARLCIDAINAAVPK